MNFRIVLILFFFSFIIPLVGRATPESLTYQGRIKDIQGNPLEVNGVQFEFSITSPTGACVIYREISNGIDMRNSSGVFDVPIGPGVKVFPSSPTFKLLDSFANATTFSCESGGTYTSLADDKRLLRVQFFDGVGWRLITPDNEIRSVPFAAIARSAEKLGNFTAADFPLLSSLPVCGAGQYLRHIAPIGTFQCTVPSMDGISTFTGGSSGLNISAGGSNQNLTLSSTGTGVVTSPSVMTVTNATASTSSGNGALVVSGGAGVAGNINAGGNIYSAGSVQAATNLITPFIYGSTSASGTLTLDSTTDVTKGNILLAPTAGKVGIGTATPATSLDVNGKIRGTYNYTGMIYLGLDPSNMVNVPYLMSGSSGGASQMRIARCMSATCGSGATGFIFDTSNYRLAINPSTLDVPYDLTLNGGGSARTIGAGRNGGSSAGAALTLLAGGAGASGTDLAGGTLNLSAGISTGSGSSSIQFQTATPGASGTTDNTPSTKMVIAGNGYVGIGTSSPMGRLDVTTSSTDVNGGIYIKNPDVVLPNPTGTFIGMELFAKSGNTFGILGVRTDGGYSGGNLALNPSGGNVGIRKTNPAYPLDVAGDVNIAAASSLRFGGTVVCTSAGCTSSSDRRLKENIQPLENSLEKIVQLQGVQYDYKDKNKFGDRHQIGVIAQDVEEIFPEVVVTDQSTGLKAVAYDHLIAPLIEALKIIYQTTLKSDERIAKLEAENAALKEYICKKDRAASLCE